MQLHFTAKDQQRFWAKVNKNGSVPNHDKSLGHCWVWTACKTFGYGKFYTGGRSNKKFWRAHCWSFVLEYGSLAPESCVLHKCDNRACVRPSHLYAGTKLDNARDTKERGRLNPAREESHYSAKMTRRTVVVARKKYASGVSVKELAAIYQVKSCTMSAIVHGKTWKNVPGAVPLCPRN